MSYFLEEFLEIFGMVLLLCAIVVAVALGTFFSVDAYQCHGMGRATGLETRWDGACFVHTKDGWVPSKFAFGDAHELRIKEQP